MIKSVSVVELQEWLQSGEVVVVDVREPQEYARGHIEGATLLPLSQVSFTALPKFHGKKLVMHCEHGKRSYMACERLIDETPGLEIYNLEGGFYAWQQAGY